MTQNTSTTINILRVKNSRTFMGNLSKMNVCVDDLKISVLNAVNLKIESFTKQH